MSLAEPEVVESEPGVVVGAFRALVLLGAVMVGALLVEPLMGWLGVAGLWPWIGLLSLVLALPFLLPRWRRPLDLFAPVTYPVWTYLAPVFVAGSVLLAAGLTRQPMPPGLISGPEQPFQAAALVFLALGWCALLLGFFWRGGEALGRRLSGFLPSVTWAPQELRAPAAQLLFGGLAVYLVSFWLGLVGHQRTAGAGRFDALLVYTTYVSHVATFLLWLSLFRNERWRAGDLAVGSALLLLGPLYLVLSGSRAVLLVFLLLLAFGFRFAGRSIRSGHVVVFLLLAVLNLALGISWGTTYRVVKGDEGRLAQRGAAPSVQPGFPDVRTAAPAPGSGRRRAEKSSPQLSSAAASERRAAAAEPARPMPQDLATSGAGVSTSDPGQLERLPRGLLRTASSLVGETTRSVLERGVRDNGRFVVQHLGQRIEITSSLAVVVANYRKLHDAEREQGIAGNILRDLATALVPRFVWPDKPKVSDARAYSLVYFRTAENSFAITPVGDLLRNFGPLGVPLGMALLGLLLRVFYRLLIEGQSVDPARASLYVIVLMNINYEGFFGAMLPVALRLLVVTVAALVFVHATIVVRRWLRSLVPST